jgi:hypothetical protein
MEARSQLHATVTLPAAKKPAVLVSQETGWNPDGLGVLQTRNLWHYQGRNPSPSTAIRYLARNPHGSLFILLPFDRKKNTGGF